MSPSYFARLFVLASASFFLLQLLVAALVAMAAPAAIRRANAMSPRHAALFLLTLRLLPAVFSALAVVALCFPSYFIFEPRAAGEEVGIACLCAAILGGFVCFMSVHRAGSAWIRTRLFLRSCAPVESRAHGEAVWIVPQNTGVALAGIVSPRLLISAEALHELSSDQLAAALRHEQAHRLSRDNFKRLLILLAPSFFPPLRTLEQSWVRYSEWAADDHASAGDADQSVVLASALVSVARLQSGMRMPALVTSLVDPDEDLSVRVHRLLNPPFLAESRFRGETFAFAGMMLFIAAIATNSACLRLIHSALEHLLD